MFTLLILRIFSFIIDTFVRIIGKVKGLPFSTHYATVLTDLFNLLSFSYNDVNISYNDGSYTLNISKLYESGIIIYKPTECPIPPIFEHVEINILNNIFLYI